MQARFADLGGYTPFASSPAEFRKFVADNVEKWAKVIRDVDIKPEINTKPLAARYAHARLAHALAAAGRRTPAA